MSEITDYKQVPDSNMSEWLLAYAEALPFGCEARDWIWEASRRLATKEPAPPGPSDVAARLEEWIGLDFGEEFAPLDLTKDIIDALAHIKNLEEQLRVAQNAADTVIGPLAQENARLEAENVGLKSGCTCRECGEVYREDVRLTDDLWNRIRPEGKPEGAGLLCGKCIGERLFKLVEEKEGLIAELATDVRSWLESFEPDGPFVLKGDCEEYGFGESVALLERADAATGGEYLFGESGRESLANINAAKLQAQEKQEDVT